MRKRLLGIFVHIFGWILVGMLVMNPITGMAHPTVDTCRHPEPPIITGSATAVCRNEAVTLSATGCAGAVIWSNGETGNVITVRPQQTTKYTAICRARPGCISCFAEVWKITVNTPDAPTVNASSTLLCAGDGVTLTATNCPGKIQWSGLAGVAITTGAAWIGNIEETTTFRATCERDGCVSNTSIGVTVQTATPRMPALSADRSEICAGQSVQLIASGCEGRVRWSDGGEGITRTVTPYQTTSYRAVCEIGSCRSDSAGALSIAVRTSDQPLAIATTATNGCPFQTADLTKTIAGNNSTSVTFYSFRTGPSPDAPAVQSPIAVLAGTYYVFARDAGGCYSAPTAVTVSISPCQNAIAPCLSNPPTVSARIDTLDWVRGVVRLQGRLGGSAGQASWQSDGGGLFTDTGLNARYLLSETDRQRGKATFTLSTPDSDGNGPCVGASTQVTVTEPTGSVEWVGLSKRVNEPVWLVDRSHRLVELTYQLTVVNLGTHPLTNVQVSDDLEAAFSVAGAQIRLAHVRADSGLVVNPTYTGRGADTTLLTTASRLPVGGRGRIWLTARLDVSQASALTFTNKASVTALDINGLLCRDVSTNGTEADPDQNGNPTDNSEPTPVTLQSLRPEEGETVFIPEGFSPNGDGINDRFVIQRLPVGTTVHLEVYNRWGHIVYQNVNYKNDWDGTANQGIKTSDAKQSLPDGTYYYQIRLSDGREFVRFMTLAR